MPLPLSTDEFNDIKAAFETFLKQQFEDKYSAEKIIPLFLNPYIEKTLADTKLNHAYLNTFSAKFIDSICKSLEGGTEFKKVFTAELLLNTKVPETEADPNNDSNDPADPNNPNKKKSDTSFANYIFEIYSKEFKQNPQANFSDLFFAKYEPFILEQAKAVALANQGTLPPKIPAVALANQGTLPPAIPAVPEETVADTSADQKNPVAKANPEEMNGGGGKTLKNHNHRFRITRKTRHPKKLIFHSSNQKHYR